MILLFRLAAVAGLVALLGACDAADPLGPDSREPTGQEVGAQIQADVEAMIAGSMAGWWRAAHGWWPGPALSTAADAHSSSWRNWGMLAAGAEPRRPLSTDPDDPFHFITQPWTELNRTLASVRDGLVAIEEGVRIGEGGSDTERAVAFGTFMQGMALGQLAQLFDAAFIVDEDTDLEAVTLSPYPQVMEAALQKLDEAITLAESDTFTIPAAWVGFHESLDQDALARLARSYRARLRISVARTPMERAMVDWQAVLDDVDRGITTQWAGYHDGNWEVNWAWSADKLWAGVHPSWARLDYRTIGPADASGAWEEWINAPPSERRPFLIDTDDRRITGDVPTSGGLYTRYEPDHLFRPVRGYDHFSYYADARWAHLFDTNGVGLYPDFPVKELDFIRAEALYRRGDRAGAMEIVNEWRAGAELPPFIDPAGVAPGGERCVPRRPNGSCGTLWDALAYEKRIELFHYGPFTEYLDDRAWGDLVQGTFTDLPAPTDDYGAVVAAILGPAAPELVDDFTARGLNRKREAYDAFDRVRNTHPGDVGAG